MLSEEQEIFTKPDTIYWRMYLSDKTQNTLVNIDLYFAARIDEGGVFKVYWMPEREASVRTKLHDLLEYVPVDEWSTQMAVTTAIDGQKITDLEVAAELFPALVEAGLTPAV
jgi:hypothetical protein